MKYLVNLFIAFETICYAYPVFAGSGSSPKVMFFLFAIFSIIDTFRRLIKEDLQGAGWMFVLAIILIVIALTSK